ncbi:ATP-dependent helicase [Blattabacterium cuenoti]|uniref:ATP-dependent helicase n=1 Tax=Blattabacterium cuenoti TaxID=1653831 RepID=UPI00163B8A5C|nr:UvrD-helicase domain-containing protein [Blattabacterium cuenoti]
MILSINNHQRKIIETINGPILVIAGAGSGKTRIITYRIIHMIKNLKIDPSKILALTFTNKAAREMKNRISKLINQRDLNKMYLGTFHSIFSGILRKESHWLGYKSNYTIYDQKDSENVIKKILMELNFKISLSPEKIRRKISEYKNNLFKKMIIDGNLYQDIKKIYKFYVQKCLKAEALDFDDILLHTNYLFNHFPNVLQKYQEKFNYILIDEYQDTNISQNSIIKNLSSKHKNVFVVGDDAQSIYAFRGANISNILNFDTDYYGAKIFRLEQNYRSTNHIVEASNNIISFNENQLFKKVWTNNEKGEKIKIYRASSDKKEAKYIASYINLKIVKNDAKFSDFSILYRTNTQSNILELALKEGKIPYKIYGSISLYQRKEIKDLLSYFRIITNPNEEESLLRIIKNQIRSKKTVKLLLESSKNNKDKNIYEILKFLIKDPKFFLNINRKTKDRLNNLIFLIEEIRLKLNDKNTCKIAKYIIDFLLKEYEDKKNNYHENDFQSILDNIFFYVEEQKKLKNGDTSLSGFLGFFSLKEGIDEVDKSHEKIENKVSLMTIHLSKGLEFPIVFISGLEENLFPSKSSLNNQLKLEEERRLFYVALTRAKKKAILTCAKYRFIWGKKRKHFPSRFIHEINKTITDSENIIDNYYKVNKKKFINLLNYEKKSSSIISNIKKGVKVFHKNFGIGTILDIQENEIAIIKFKESGIKKILLSLAKLIFYS